MLVGLCHSLEVVALALRAEGLDPAIGHEQLVLTYLHAGTCFV